MLLVIFGAGASYDAVDITAVRQVQAAMNFRPPLANDLFADRPNFNALAARYPQFGDRILPLRRAAKGPGFNLERELQAIRAEIATYPAATSELAGIQFYLRDLLTECGDRWYSTSAGLTNYQELLGRIDRYRVTVAPRLERDQLVAFVTFNYDTLIDRALGQHPARLHLNVVEDYGGREPYKLFKPHGSVDWGQVVDWTPQQMGNEQIVNFVIENIASLKVRHGYVMNPGREITVSVENSPYRRPVIPAIAIPVVEKSDFACPDSHLASLDQCLSRITHVVTIGWRGSEQHYLDRFIKPISSSLAGPWRRWQRLGHFKTRRGSNTGWHLSGEASLSF
jgi:hypothetical protein